MESARRLVSAIARLEAAAAPAPTDDDHDGYGFVGESGLPVQLGSLDRWRSSHENAAERERLRGRTEVELAAAGSRSAWYELTRAERAALHGE